MPQGRGVLSASLKTLNERVQEFPVGAAAGRRRLDHSTASSARERGELLAGAPKTRGPARPGADPRDRRRLVDALKRFECRKRFLEGVPIITPRVQSADPNVTQQGIKGQTPRFESAKPGDTTQKFTPRR